MLHCSQDSLSENVEVKKLISKNEFRSVLRQAHPKPNTLVNLGNMNFQHYWNPIPMFRWMKASFEWTLSSSCSHSRQAGRYWIEDLWTGR